MAQGNYIVDLTEPDFPLLAQNQVRTIIRRSASALESTPTDEKPGIAYCHNVLPTKKGLLSVGYREVVPRIFDPATTTNRVVDTRPMFGNKGTRFDISWDRDGRMYVLKYGFFTWVKVEGSDFFAAIIPNFDINLVTICTVKGVSYICYSGITVFIYDEDNNTLINKNPLGLSIGQVKGIAAAGNYLIAYTETIVAWSSLLEPTDFVPSAITGAGAGTVAGLDGPILFIVSHPTGLIIYSRNNAVAASTTGNGVNPFKFRKIDDSKGGLSLDQVTYEATSKYHYAFTRAGLQAIDSLAAEILLPQVTDFLSGRRYEDFDEQTLRIITYNIPNELNLSKKLKYISSRYLVISYGWVYFTHALVYDIALNRMGKLRIDHTDVFELVAPTGEPAKESIAFLLSDGSVKVVETSVTRESSGVLMLAKMQATLSRITTILGVEVENVEEDDQDYQLYNVPSLDGKTLGTPIPGYLLNSAENYRKYNFMSAAKNHSLLMIGKFNLVTALVTYTLNGRT